ncbi:MAG: hypothetical protein KAJ07_08790 [Planctomycetes bacterium]|nr:hypothetical protein [Planctomycetota bacterium]
MKKTMTILMCLVASMAICGSDCTEEVKNPDAKGNNAEISQKQTAQDQDDRPSFLPEGTIIFRRTEDEIICFLPQDTEIQGLVCRGDGHDWQTVFYTNGKLALAWLAETTEIQGVPCMAASFLREVFGGSSGVRFHDNGNLSRCKLAKNFTIEGRAFKKGDHLSFDREGKLIVK